MLSQPVANKRCASCECWRGQRQPGPTPGWVNIESELSTGLCVNGGWDGDERRARSACGHWKIWLLVADEHSK